MKELNEKLAKWAGLKYQMASDGDWAWFDKAGCPLSPTGLSGEPYFTSSLDACFKWLVPKLDAKDIHLQIYDEDKGNWQADIMYGEYWAMAETPALSLCRAIEKLIEAENEQSTNEEAGD